MSKKIAINDNRKVMKGFNLVCDAVKVTLGSEGGYGVMENEHLGFPIISKDGISLARKVFDNDKMVNMGCSIAKQASARSLLLSGDSTTSTLVLSQALAENCKKDGAYFFNKKVELGIENGYKEIESKLKKLSKKVDKSSVKKIATISANGSKEIGDIVFKAYETVGANGLIDVQETESPFTVLKASKGMKINKGFMSPFLINNQKTGVYEALDAKIIIYNGFEIHNCIEVKDFINSNKKFPILIVAERINSEDWVRELYRINQGGFNITAIECSEFDVKREAILEDIALYTGGEVFIQGTSTEVFPGVAKKVLVEQNNTSFFQDEISETVLNKISDLKSQLATTSDTAFFRKRIANLEGTSATILVGGTSPQEIKEKFDRVEDSVSAVKSSLIDGCIAGGGATLVYISNSMNTTFDNTDIQFGYDVIKKAIQSPFNQICINARREPLDYLQSAKDMYGFGYNSHKDEISNLLKDGVIDSKRSIQIALEQAKSTAILLMNIKVAITF